MLTRYKIIWEQILLVVAVGLAVRIHKVHYNFDGDEIFSVELASKQFSQVILGSLQDRPHPPLHNILLHLWIKEQQKKSQQKLLEERRKIKAREVQLRQQAARLTQVFKKERAKLLADKKRAPQGQASKVQQQLRWQREEIEKSLTRKMEA